MEYGATSKVFAGVALYAITMAPGEAAGGPACDAITAPPGAVYLSSDESANATFNGNTFLIDGNDGRLDGGAGTALAVFGVATRTEVNAQAVRDSLAGTQRDNVMGRDYSPGPPIQPSVAATAGPSDAEISQPWPPCSLVPIWWSSTTLESMGWPSSGRRRPRRSRTSPARGAASRCSATATPWAPAC